MQCVLHTSWEKLKITQSALHIDYKILHGVRAPIINMTMISTHVDADTTNYINVEQEYQLIDKLQRRSHLRQKW